MSLDAPKIGRPFLADRSNITKPVSVSLTDIQKEMIEEIIEQKRIEGDPRNLNRSTIIQDAVELLYSLVVVGEAPVAAAPAKKKTLVRPVLKPVPRITGA